MEKEELKKKKIEEKKVEAENISTKILKPLTFDNGIMISSLKELAETLPGIELAVFKIHVNSKRHDIAKWAEQVSPELSKKILAEIEKSKIVEILNNFIKDYPASNYKEDANYYLCLSHYYYAINSVKNKQLTRFQQAMDAINNFMSLYPNSQYINKLNDIKAEIQKQINLKQNI